MSKLDTNDIYAAVTARMMGALKEAIEAKARGEKSTLAPWAKPWVGAANAPRSIHGRPYRGMNAILLSLSGYDDPRWATFNQTRKLGGKVREGEKSTMVILWKMLKFKDKDAEDGFKLIPSLRYFRVFNIEQTTLVEDEKVKAWELPELPGDFDPMAEAEAVWSDWDETGDAPELSHGGDRACYAPAADHVTMPKREKFKSAEGYYTTLWHEGAHATGHPTRLDRIKLNDFSDKPNYSREELVAEMTAAFICAHVGIEGTFENSAAYLKSWLNALEDDPKMIVWAAGRAQKAADRILGITPEKAEDAKPETETEAVPAYAGIRPLSEVQRGRCAPNVDVSAS